MNKFNDIDELRSFLRKDRNVASLSPIRIINVDTMEMWTAVKKLLLSMSQAHICLSSFCSGEDTTPNMRRLLAKMKTTTESLCVSPISEYLRLKPDLASSTIEDILSKEYIGNVDGKLRIYIPMYRLKNILQTVSGSDPRKKDCINYLFTGEEPDYSLSVIQKELDVRLPGNEIFGFKQYLQYWEQNPDKPLILHTKNACHFEGEIFFDNVNVIVTPFDVLKTYYQLPAVYREYDGPTEYWNRLAKVISDEKTFENACCRELLINKYTTKLFEKWESCNDFQKWLLWLWTRVKSPKNYLGICIFESSNEKEFVELIYNKILFMLGKPEQNIYYDERKNLIQKMGLVSPSSFWNLLNDLSALNKLQVLCNLSQRERETIFYTLNEIKEAEQNEAITILQHVYPELGNYIQSDGIIGIDDFPDEFSSYFEQYRWNKAANVMPESFVNMVRSIAMKRGASVYEIKSRNLIVSEEYDKDSTLIFVDGMGMEYAEYISMVLKPLKTEGYRIRARAGYCNLPSTTEKNKDYLVDRNVYASFLELDEMKHGGSKYPMTIEHELSFLNTLRDKIRNAFESGVSRVILSSDHGTSRLAVLVRKTEYDTKVSPEGHSIYKYGRYCDGVDLADKFETAIEYDNKLIFADYMRFEQKGAPIDEIHGGASLEEWIVPVFIIEKTAIRKEKLNVTIIPPKTTLRIDPLTKMVTVNFDIRTYSKNDVSVRIHGKKICCNRTDRGYVFKYEPLKNESEINTTVFIKNDNVGMFKFSIKQSITQNNKFDL